MKATNRAELIAQIAASREMQEQDVAQLVGVTPGRLSNWKKKRDDLNPKVLAELSKLSGMDADSISKLEAETPGLALHETVRPYPILPPELRIKNALNNANVAATELRWKEISARIWALLEDVERLELSKPKSDDSQDEKSRKGR